MKIVVDTNVFISGAFWGGKPLKILELIADGKVQFFVTPKILSEYLRLLKEIDKKRVIL